MKLLTSKKSRMILIICILGVIIISIFSWLNKQKFITQTKDNLANVTFILEPYHLGQNKVVRVTTRSEMEQVYEILNRTIKLHAYKYPRHSESIQWDSDIAVHFEYRNGKKDEFLINKNGSIVRFLTTSGDSNDPGYIIGSNEELFEFISSVSWLE